MKLAFVGNIMDVMRAIDILITRDGGRTRIADIPPRKYIFKREARE